MYLLYFNLQTVSIMFLRPIIGREMLSEFLESFQQDEKLFYSGQNNNFSFRCFNA